MITQDQVYTALAQAIDDLGLSPGDYRTYGYSANSEDDLVWFGFYGPNNVLLHQIEISV